MKMRHLQAIIIARIGYFQKYTKIAETLVNTEFPLSLHRERAGIRTPDNLIKSQVVRLPFRLLKSMVYASVMR